MRIWLKPDRMAALNISPAQVRQVLAANNYLAAVGQTKGALVKVNLTANTDLHTAEDFKNLVVRQQNGRLIRLSDIADVVLGAEDYDTEVRFSQQHAVFMGIRVLPNANSVDVIKRARAELESIKRDLPTGIFPYNVAIAPNGKIAIAVNNGAGGGSDGNVDTASVIDLEADPVRVIDHVVVGDAPEGFAISPKGDLAVAILLRGSNADKKAFYYNPGGAVVALKIDGKKVTKTGEVVVGGLPEGVAFSPKGDYLYVGNFIDQDLSVLKVDGDKLTDTGKRFKLPGHPASMRSGPQ